MKKPFVLVVLTVLLFILISSLNEMPSLGDRVNPSYNEVAEYYISNAKEDTNTMNIIAAIITDYRAFDTLGETTVLFTSITAVVSVLGFSMFEKKEK
jgi:multicomponent Na+:H+ antiporter subunit B